MIREIYPSFLEGRNEANILALWTKLFAEETYFEMETAIMAYICRDTKGFPPAVGALKELIYQQRNNSPTEQEAWTMVKNALSGSWAHAKARFESLPEIVQRCVGTPETLRAWGQIDQEQLDTVIASHFKRNYREEAARKKDMDKLPAGIRRRFEKMAPQRLGREEAKALPTVERTQNYVPCPDEISQRVRQMLENEEGMRKDAIDGD